MNESGFGCVGKRVFGEVVPAARRHVARVLNLPDPGTVVFAPNTHEFLRRLLIEAAHYTLGPFAPDSELRRFGLRLFGQGGKRAKKRAVVAVARKLAVLLHRLWVTGEVYHALGTPGAEAEAA